MRQKVFTLDSDLKRYKATNTMQVKSQQKTPFEEVCHAKLSFFHYWIFYYLYSADHKFLEAIFRNEFAFVSYLFSNDFR